MRHAMEKGHIMYIVRTYFFSIYLNYKRFIVSSLKKDEEIYKAMIKPTL
jgi:hypothetical protein